LVLAEALRDLLPGLRLQLHCGGGGFKNQFKRADRSGARFALVLGEEEVAEGCIAVKSLRESVEQIVLPQDKLAAFLDGRLQGEIRSRSGRR
jgi:histidyl-tRNA synthetase